MSSSNVVAEGSESMSRSTAEHSMNKQGGNRVVRKHEVYERSHRTGSDNAREHVAFPRQEIKQPAPQGHGVGFEGEEHKAIGDQVMLKMTGAEIIKGLNFAFLVQDGSSRTLSFGDITALAGDFYANWSVPISDAPHPGAQLKLNADSLFQNTKGYLSGISSVFMDEAAAIDTALRDGKDVVKVYKDNAMSWLGRFTKATKGDFLLILMTNWDHFGADAVTCYTSGHHEALQIANNGTTRADLQRAYAYDAFANHFLTDLFSTGHLRTPRRAMHSDYYWNLSFSPDACSNLIHDEDSASGLLVTNKNGDKWLAYGDKQLFSAKSRVNLQRAIACVQAGADEIKTAFNGGTVPLDRDFKALKLAPDPARFSGTTSQTDNPAPLFAYDAATKKFKQRNNVKNQSDPRQLDLNDPNWIMIYANTYFQFPPYLPSADLTGIVSTVMQFYVRHRKLGVNFWGCIPKVTTPQLVNGTFTWLNENTNLDTLDEIYQVVSLGYGDVTVTETEFLTIDASNSGPLAREPRLTLYRANISPGVNTISHKGTTTSSLDPDPYPNLASTEKWLVGNFIDGWDSMDPQTAVFRCPSISKFSLYLRQTAANESFKYYAQANALHPTLVDPLSGGYQVGSIFAMAVPNVSQQQLIRVGTLVGGPQLTIEAVWAKKQPNNSYQLQTKYWTVPAQHHDDMGVVLVGQLYYARNISNIVVPFQDSQGNFRAFVMNRITSITSGPELRGEALFQKFGISGGALRVANSGKAWYFLNTQGTSASPKNDLVCILKQSPAANETNGKVSIVVNPAHTDGLFNPPVVTQFDDPFSNIDTIDILPVSFEYPGALSVKTHAGLLQLFNVDGVVGVRLFAPISKYSRTFKIWGCIPRLGQPADSWWDGVWAFRDKTTFFQVGPV